MSDGIDIFTKVVQVVALSVVTIFLGLCCLGATMSLARIAEALEVLARASIEKQTKEDE